MTMKWKMNFFPREFFVGGTGATGKIYDLLPGIIFEPAKSSGFGYHYLQHH